MDAQQFERLLRSVDFKFEIPHAPPTAATSELEPSAEIVESTGPAINDATLAHRINAAFVREVVTRTVEMMIAERLVSTAAPVCTQGQA